MKKSLVYRSNFNQAKDYIFRLKLSSLHEQLNSWHNMNISLINYSLYLLIKNKSFSILFLVFYLEDNVIHFDLIDRYLPVSSSLLHDTN